MVWFLMVLTSATISTKTFNSREFKIPLYIAYQKQSVQQIYHKLYELMKFHL